MGVNVVSKVDIAGLVLFSVKIEALAHGANDSIIRRGLTIWSRGAIHGFFTNSIVNLRHHSEVDELTVSSSICHGFSLSFLGDFLNDLGENLRIFWFENVG